MKDVYGNLVHIQHDVHATCMRLGIIRDLCMIMSTEKRFNLWGIFTSFGMSELFVFSKYTFQGIQTV